MKTRLAETALEISTTAPTTIFILYYARRENYKKFQRTRRDIARADNPNEKCWVEKKRKRRDEAQKYYDTRTITRKTTTTRNPDDARRSTVGENDVCRWR